MLDDVPFCYLTTTGRTSQRPHRIEIWFATEDGRTLFLLAGAGRGSDWVANLEAEPAVELELDGVTHQARARIVEAGSEEDARARRLLVAKYRTSDDDLAEWGRTSLPVAVDLEPIGA